MIKINLLRYVVGTNLFVPRPKWQQFSGCFFAYGTNKFVPTVLFTLCLALPVHASQPDPVMMSNMAALRDRVAKATDSKDANSVNLSLRAQIWIDFVQEEFIELDNTGVAEDALQRVMQIIGWLENKQPEGAPIPATLRGTTRVREDLWKRLAAAQLHSQPCATPYLAQAEIHLLWAAHEQPELGWRHASRYIQDAANLLDQAECCVVKVPPVVIPPVVEVPPVATPPAIPVADVPVPPALDKIPDVVHFAFDRYTISPESDKVLQIVAKTMFTYPWLKLELGGHTDRRGNQNYNMKLSQRRVSAVYNRLIALGLPADRFVKQAHGMSKMLMKTDDKLARALDRRVELIMINPNDPAATMRIHSESQKDDLQQ